MVEHEFTRNLHVFLNPLVKPISRSTITRWCMKTYDKLKVDVFRALHELPGKVCLTCDVWTACTSRAYLTLTCHGITNEWVLKSRVLNFRYFPPPHTGHETYELVWSLVKSWGLEKKVLTMTIDNATAMDNMINRLRTNFNIHSSLFDDGSHFHIRCSAHILNLIVQKGLTIVDRSVRLVRDIVKYVDNNDARKNRFRECIHGDLKPANISLWLDVQHRWNSTYIMLKRALEYKSALTLFGDTERDFPYHISTYDWSAVEKVCILLEPFYVITNLFSGSDYPTSNLYLQEVVKIQYHLTRACESEDDNIRNMAIEMFKKFEKYWSSYTMILSLASVFDPRHKLPFVKHNLKFVYDDGADLSHKMEMIELELVRLFNFYKGSLDPMEERSTTIASSSSSRLSSDGFESFDSCQERVVSDGESELKIYLNAPLLKAATDFDILIWWRDYGAKDYPILAKIARDLLAIPITTVASESSFSMGSRILHNWRASLTNEHAEAFITSRNWLFGYEHNYEDDVSNDAAPDAESYAEEGDHQLDS